MVFTVGHSARSIDDFISILHGAGIDLVADVRAIPASRTHPQFNLENLRNSLTGAAVDYVHLPELGGRRRRTQPSPNTFWQNDGFRAYADYAWNQEFRAGLEQLERLAAAHSCAVMCAEALWWRCHRRIIADYLLADGIAVAHILSVHSTQPAALTPLVQRLPDRRLLYEAP